MSGGTKAQKRGTSAEEHVLAHLKQRGHKGLIQRRRSIRTKRGTIYPDKQGCDIIGSTKWGQALFVEVKAYSGKSVPIAQNKGLLLSQLAFLQDMQINGCLAVIAFVLADQSVHYVKPSTIIRYLTENHKTSYPMDRLKGDRFEL